MSLWKWERGYDLDLIYQQTAALRAKAAADGLSLEGLAALPEDGLSQIDHHVYGVPKTTP